ncbi:VOC family protein [Bosea sp. PAMC 26642]|uniref:VOC family protein n=1 Tax=Bosea sp. (strain PAMC 26642) TaxID=1792307 RepID=UPI0007703DF9|nr:VOC family protein [Bosea sp. PAMC 26642]AMJ60391.1 glyoxalase [Bosea sp. PAMC 26642]
MTRFPVSGLRSVAIATPDLALSERFYTQVWGLTVAARQGDVVYLRATGADHHVLALHAGAEPEILSVTFRVDASADLAALAEQAVVHGAMLMAPPGPNPEPDGGIVVTIAEPQGGVYRFVQGDRTHDDATEVRDRPSRLAHVNLNSIDVDAQAAFYENGLGFTLTDRSKLMAFLRCNSDHHAVVLAEAKANGLNHIAFLLPDWESVMRASGRLVDAGHPIAWGVGRHGPGDNVFSYFIDPVGFVIEFTAEVLQVDDTYRVRGPDEWVWPPGRTDHWGVAPPKADHVKAAQMAIVYRAPGSDKEVPGKKGEPR